jgi:hypothetical protein
MVAPVNLARVLLHPDGVAPRIGNLTEWGWHVVDGLQRKAIRDANPSLEALIAELREYVPPLPRRLPVGHWIRGAPTPAVRSCPC